MNLTEQIGEDTKPIPDLKEIQVPPQEVETQPITEAPVAGLDGSTVRLDCLPHLNASFVSAQENAMEKKIEPFSEAWEPDYEEPIADYIPPEKVIEHPRSRMRQIKRKLLAGPGKRYYELSTQRSFKLRAAVFLSMLLVAVSGLAAGAYAGGFMGLDRLRFMVFSQVLIMLLAALIGSNQLLDGLADLFVRGRFTLKTLLAATFAACACDAIFCLQEERVPLCAAFALEVVMSLWAELQRRGTELSQMDTLRKALRLDGLYRVRNFYDGRDGIVRDVGDVDAFMDHYNKIPAPQRRQNYYALLCFFVSLGVSIAAGVLHGLPMALLMLSTTLLVSVPASFFVALTRPAAVLERKLHRLGTVICGWQGICGMGGRVSVPLCDMDMFPRGTTQMNGVKFYGERDPEQVIAYAAALICAGGGGLAPLFEELLRSRSCPRYDVKSFRRYPGGGIGGEVCDEPVLVGTLQFLQDMGVEVPPGTMVNQAVHLSIDGQLCGLFAINYNRSKYSAAGLATLAADRRITEVVTAGDFMLNDSFLRAKFGINPKRVAFPDLRERFALNRIAPADGDTALALVTREGLAPAAYAITGARALRTAWRLGMAIHIFGGMLGMLIMVVLAILGSVELLTPINILLYQLVWMIPGLLVTFWPKTI